MQQDSSVPEENTKIDRLLNYLKKCKCKIIQMFTEQKLEGRQDKKISSGSITYWSIAG